MKKVIIIVVIAVVVIGAGVLLAIQDAKHPELKDPWANKSTRELVLGCEPQEYTNYHIHPLLSIKVNGESQQVPANIGIQGLGTGNTSHAQAQSQASCLHAIHTHDASGTIHVESPVKRDFILGDLFAVWDKVFTKDQILDHKVDDTHKIVMTVNGEVSDQYENLILKDQDKIEISYETK
jgi:sulfur carrier protein ThiS